MADREGNTWNVELKSVQFGNRVIRYFLWEPNEIMHTDELTLQDCKKEHIMFLGTDVMKNCPISHKNLPRYHCHNSTHGLATKVVFPTHWKVLGMKLNSLSKCAWFYNVRGLFRVAFEFYSTKEQTAVLSSMKDEFLKFTEAFADGTFPCDIGVKTWGTLCKGNRNSATISTENSDPTDETGALSTQTIMKENPNAHKKLMLYKVSQQNDHDYATSTKSSKSFTSTESGIDTRPELVESNQAQSDIGDEDRCILSLLEKFQTEIFNMTSKTPGNVFVQSIGKLAIDCLEIVHQEAVIFKRANHNIFPLNIIQEYLNGKKSIEVLDIAHDYELVLHLMSGWIGEQFSSLRGFIKTKADHFKQQHILSIQNMPPPKEILREIFPSGMCLLLCEWLKHRQEVMAAEDNEMLQCADCKDAISLLCLELLNGTLITGKGHVLLSKIHLTEHS